MSRIEAGRGCRGRARRTGVCKQTTRKCAVDRLAARRSHERETRIKQYRQVGRRGTRWDERWEEFSFHARPQQATHGRPRRMVPALLW